MFSLEPPAAPSSGAAADHVVALAMAGRVPWAGSTGRVQRTGRTPVCCAQTGLLEPVARNLIRFFRIAIRFRQNASNIPTHETAPFSLNDWYPAENL
jgi:hypothetical protein